MFEYIASVHIFGQLLSSHVGALSANEVHEKKVVEINTGANSRLKACHRDRSNCRTRFLASLSILTFGCPTKANKPK